MGWREEGRVEWAAQRRRWGGEKTSCDGDCFRPWCAGYYRCWNFPMNYEFGRHDGLTRNTGARCGIEKGSTDLFTRYPVGFFYYSHYLNFHFKPMFIVERPGLNANVCKTDCRFVVWRTTTIPVSWASNTYVQIPSHSSVNVTTLPCDNYVITWLDRCVAKPPSRVVTFCPVFITSTTMSARYCT